MALGDYRGAIGWFQAAIDAAPLHPYVSDAYFGIAVCEYLLGHTEKAIALGRESLSRDRSGNIIGLWLATVLEIEGRRAEAQSALDEFYRHHPEFPQASTAPARIIRMLSPEAERTFAAMRSLGVPDIETH
jgi:tetratricopeptide (TPR) repeat protein